MLQTDVNSSVVNNGSHGHIVNVYICFVYSYGAQERDSFHLFSIRVCNWRIKERAM